MAMRASIHTRSAFDRQLGDYDGLVGRKPESQLGLGDQIVAGAVILEPENLAGVCAHYGTFLSNSGSSRASVLVQ
jgi:hypothetical protein